MNWIKCSDRMPVVTKITEDYAVSDDLLLHANRPSGEPIIFVGRWDERGGSKILNRFTPSWSPQLWGLCPFVTHWMPLPEAPKDEE